MKMCNESVSEELLHVCRYSAGMSVKCLQLVNFTGLCWTIVFWLALLNKYKELKIFLIRPNRNLIYVYNVQAWMLRVWLWQSAVYRLLSNRDNKKMFWRNWMWCASISVFPFIWNKLHFFQTANTPAFRFIPHSDENNLPGNDWLLRPYQSAWAWLWLITEALSVSPEPVL